MVIVNAQVLCLSRTQQWQLAGSALLQAVHLASGCSAAQAAHHAHLLGVFFNTYQPNMLLHTST